jgi:hypothetical protein
LWSILAFKSAIKPETLWKEGNPPLRASCIAVAVAAFGGNEESADF